jgi:hypothetical protein
LFWKRLEGNSQPAIIIRSSLSFLGEFPRDATTNQGEILNDLAEHIQQIQTKGEEMAQKQYPSAKLNRGSM